MAWAFCIFMGKLHITQLGNSTLHASDFVYLGKWKVLSSALVLSSAFVYL